MCNEKGTFWKYLYNGKVIQEERQTKAKSDNNEQFGCEGIEIHRVKNKHQGPRSVEKHELLGVTLDAADNTLLRVSNERTNIEMKIAERLSIKEEDRNHRSCKIPLLPSPPTFCHSTTIRQVCGSIKSWGSYRLLNDRFSFTFLIAYSTFGMSRWQLFSCLELITAPRKSDMNMPLLKK